MAKIAVVEFKKSWSIIVPDDATEDQIKKAAVVHHNEYATIDDIYLHADDAHSVTIFKDVVCDDSEIDIPEFYED